MRIRITGFDEAQFQIMNAFAVMGEFKPSERPWYASKVGQVLEVKSRDDNGRYISSAYGCAICARDAKEVPEKTPLSLICEKEVQALTAARERSRLEKAAFERIIKGLDKVFSKKD